MVVRKILHIDMDAFYASVEQRDDPTLRKRPVIVAWRGPRSVVCAASYEARTFGVHSAMPALRAERLCPTAVFVPPDFTRYRAASMQLHEIFARYTDCIEPLSLDEAYLDVTVPKIAAPSATATAEAIRADISAELQLTASAGVAPNKFLAKIASDWRKPDGLFVIKPSQIERFLTPLPVGKIPGVGKVMCGKLKALGITTVGELRALSERELDARFGKFGGVLYRRARGKDERPVQPHRPTRQVSAEDTFEHDRTLDELDDTIVRLVEKVWQASKKTDRLARTVVLKLKTAQFRSLTRSHTPLRAPTSAQDVLTIARVLRDRVELPPSTRYRLVGVGLGGFRDREEFSAQPTLFPL